MQIYQWLKKRVGENEKDEKYREEKIINEGKNKDVEKEKKIRDEIDRIREYERRRGKKKRRRKVKRRRWQRKKIVKGRKKTEKG